MKSHLTGLAQRSWLALVLLILGCALYASTLGSSYADLGGAFSPVFFPRIILIGWIVLALLLVVADVLSAHTTDAIQWLAVVIVSVAMYAYTQFMPVVGFFISSVVFSIVVLLATGQRKPLDVIVFSIAVPGALLILFNHILTMPLPVSPYLWWL